MKSYDKVSDLVEAAGADAEMVEDVRRIERLHAAAPLLYEACKAVYRDLIEFDATGNNVIKQLRDALAAADGSSSAKRN